jgi:hypothetical protein
MHPLSWPRHWHRPLLALTLLAGLAAPLPAAPRDELLRLVPPDVGFCLVLQDLRGHAAALADSPFVEQLSQSALGRLLRAKPEWSKLDGLEAKLKKDLDVTWDRLRDEFLGDAVVLAFRPDPAGRKDQGLILLRARTPQSLADLVTRINQVQQNNGELKTLEKLEYKGITYYRREEARATNYYCLRGPVLIFSGEQVMLHQALDLGLRESGRESGAEPDLARRLREAGADKAVIALWVNPRALDAQVEGRAAAGQEAEQETARKTFAACWKALDDVVLSLELGRDLSVSLALRGRPEQMPPGVRRFLAELSRPSELWRSFPQDALFALALRLDPAALLDAISDFIPTESRQSLEVELNRTLGAALGKDIFKDLLPGIGPDVGVCVTAPAPGDKDWFPRVVLAVRAAGGPAAVDQSLLSALHVAAVGLVLGYNSEHRDHALRLATATVDKQEVKYLDGPGVLPAGLRPAAALRDGYLVLASSPGVLRGFRAEPPGAPGATVPLVRVSFRGLRAYLRQRHDSLAGALAQKEGADRDEVGRRLDTLLDVLEFLDRLEVRQRTAPGLVVFTLSLQTAQPLKR